ncbi:MAG: NADP-dependent malic enzyme [bacterium]|nr:NADP-dependent malic enzyme [bacterium]
MNTTSEKAIALHEKLKGKIEITAKIPVQSMEDLALVYTPGVGAVSHEIAENPERVNDLTWKKNVVAIVSDGSAVLGLGNIGPLAALPVMEGKSVIFKQFAGIDAIPIVLNTQDTEEIIKTVLAISPTFGAIQLEDISAPRCFEIEERLADALNMPVFHDDQHGTAIVVMAGLMNALKVVGKNLNEIKIAMVGAGAAGTAIANILIHAGAKNVLVCDRIGIIAKSRDNLNAPKKKLAEITNKNNIEGTLADAVRGADVIIGTSGPGLIHTEMISSMNSDAIVFALANPTPEIMPDDAKSAGARVVATGRSDFPNQVNNALCYPGLFRGMLDNNIIHVTPEIKIRAATAIANMIQTPTAENIIPNMFTEGLHEAVAKSITSK